MRSRLAAVLAVVVAVLLAPFPVALAQEGTPAATPAAGVGEVDLAAMALTVNDLPPGYEFDFGRYLPAELVPMTFGFTPDEVAATEVIRIYETSFFNRDTQEGTRLYIDLYPSVEAAEAGFASLRTRRSRRTIPCARSRAWISPAPASASHLRRSPPRPGQVCLGEVHQEIDATFRVGTIGAGVAVGGPLEETGEEAPPPDPEQLRQVTELAGVLHDRITAVLAGQSPAGTDLALPGVLLPIEGTWSGLAEGYLSPAQALRGSIDIPPEAMFTSGYYRTTATGPLGPQGSNLPPDWLYGPPHVTIGVADFADAEAAAAALDLARTGEIPFVLAGPREFVPDPAVPDAEAAVAYRTSLLPLPGKDPDTFGVAFTVGDRLAVVEVVDAPEMEQLALDLAARQAACLAGNACEPVNLTSEAVVATPSASALATPVVGEAMVRTLMAATVEVPAEEHYVDLFRVGYAPGAVEQSHAATGPTLDLVTAGSLAIAVEGSAMVTRAEDPTSE